MQQLLKEEITFMEKLIPYSYFQEMILKGIKKNFISPRILKTLSLDIIGQSLNLEEGVKKLNTYL